MTMLLALVLLGVLLGFGGAFVAKALRDGGPGYTAFQTSRTAVAAW